MSSHSQTSGFGSGLGGKPRTWDKFISIPSKVDKATLRDKKRLTHFGNLDG